MTDDQSEGQVRAFLSRATGRSMSLIELMLVVFILAVLAAGAGPIYRGYAVDAKTTEAKMLAGSLWTAITSRAVTACGSAAPMASIYNRAGLDATGTTVPPRWMVVAGVATSFAADCATGAFSPAGDVFMLMGLSEDVSAIRVKLSYSPVEMPQSRLLCSADAGQSFSDC